MAEIKITKDNFNDIIENSKLPILIDFWATWCGPCKMIAPIIEEIAEEYEGEIIVGKVNVDEEQAIASLFQIRSIPTLAVVKDGKVENTAVGFMSKSEVLELLK